MFICCYMNILVAVEDDQNSVELCVTAKKLIIQSNDADCAAMAVVGGRPEVEVKPEVDCNGDGAVGLLGDGERTESGRWLVGKVSRVLVSSSQ